MLNLSDLAYARNLTGKAPTRRDSPFRLRVGDTVLVPGPLRTSVALAVATSDRPRLSWVVPLIRIGQKQTGYRIVAASGDDPLSDPDLWDSGLVDSDRNYGILWGGSPLSAGTTVRWSVMVRDDGGALSEWSEVVEFITPPLQASDWTGQWLSVPATKAALVQFEIVHSPDRAILHFAAQGWMRAVVDGQVVNAHARDPCDTARTRAVSRSYDVTPFLDQTRSSHKLAFVGALGHHHEVLDTPRVLAQLILTSHRAETRRVVTAPDWSVVPTSLLVESPFFAEVHDATRRDEWMHSLPNSDPCTPVTLVSSSSAARWPLPKVVSPDAGPGIRVVEERKAKALASTPAAQVFDIGDNVAARSCICLSGTRLGQRVVVAHGEMLDQDGRVDTTNISLPWGHEQERQLVEWICAGSDEMIEPWFAIHGFRYLEVRGVEGAQILQVTARVMHSDVEVIGSFFSSDPLVDRLVAQAVRTQLNNIHGHPEDCPSREHGGWTGDASVAAEAALCVLDMAGVYRNWLIDVAEDQCEDGGILGLTPFVLSKKARQPADPVWGSAMTEIPWQLWWHTGDADALAHLLPAMRRWVDWQLGTVDGGVVRHADISYGADWLALKQTPPVLLQTAAVIRSIRALADIEEAQGKQDAAAIRRDQAKALIQSARSVLWDSEEGVWGNGSQASYGVALASGMVEEGECVLVRSRLKQAIDKHDGRLDTGYAGTQSVVRAVSEMDGGAQLLKLVHEPTQPGIGAMLVDGPGTFWEMWWIEHSQVGTASLDHIGLAAPFAAWAWRYLAGLRAIEPGHRLFSVDLRSSSLITSLDVKMMTVRGEISIWWSRTDDRVDVQVVVPVGAEALVIPSVGTKDIQVDGVHEPLDFKQGFRLGSGQHHLLLSGVSAPPHRSFSPIPPARDCSTLWLSGLRDVNQWSTPHGQSSVHRIRERWVCSPVFHEAVEGDILQVSHSGLPAGEERWICLTFELPFALHQSRFVFAYVDVDNGTLPGRVVRPRLRVRSRDGTERVGSTRVMPAAWNRVAVDISGWSGRTAVSEVAIGISWSREHDVARGADIEPPAGTVDFSMMVSRVGYSLAKRTW